jgi:hypothetical protein
MIPTIQLGRYTATLSPRSMADGVVTEYTVTVLLGRESIGTRWAGIWEEAVAAAKSIIEDYEHAATV